MTWGTFSPWTEERIADLPRLAAEGLSATEMAERLGGGLTRNAVLGKLFRLGLSKPRPKVVLGNGKAATVRRQRMDRHNLLRRIARASNPQPKPHPAPSNQPVPLNLDLAALEPGQCRWAVNDGLPHLFCGHAVTHEHSYCNFHLWRSFARSERNA